MPGYGVMASQPASFRTVECTAIPSGGAPPYSYQWSYTGTASYWGSNGNHAIASWPASGCYGYSRFDVIVTDSCNSTASDTQTVNCD